jgi:protein-tyrosine phosphatase
VTKLQTRSRRLSWDACYNARDVGGYETCDGPTTRWDALLRADNLCRLTGEGRAALIDHGVTTIIDLRTERELEVDLPPFRTNPSDGVAYHHLALFPDDDHWYGELAQTSSSGEMYRLFLDRWGERIAGIITVIARAPEGGVLVHCHGGKDRTGVIVALLLALVGVPDATIAEDFALSDVYLRPWYDEMLAPVEDPEQRERLTKQIFTAFPETMLATLEYLRDEYGGAEQYLLSHGAWALDIERLRNRLV